jgi:pimeloyl-ACP methyl ester carboxylesterase
MTLQLPLLFNSPSDSRHQIHYVHLNSSAQHTLLLCYGAGGSSTFLTLYQDYLTSHPKLGLLCVDRWALGQDITAGPALLSSLSSITVELLDHLSIPKISVAAHSAGAYEALDFINRFPERTTGHVFPICTHIPAPYTGSKIMSWICTMPEPLFAAVTAIDQLSDTKVERLWLRLVGSPKTERIDDGTFVDSQKLRSILENYKPDKEEVALHKARLDLDYRLGYSRIPGIRVDDLVELYKDCKLDLIWFTCEADIFFGPASVERITKDMTSCKVEVVLVEGASHSDIFLRKELWDRIYEQITAGT